MAGTAQGESVFMGVAAQTTNFSTVETTGFTHLPVKAGSGIQMDRPSKGSDQLRGAEPRDMRSQNQTLNASIIMECLIEIFTLLLDMAFARSTSEVASYIIDSTNNKIDFNEGSGEVNATIASGSYTAAQLCAAMDTALDAAGSASDYTTTYSTATGKFTITQDTPGTFSILWKTGTNGADNGDTSVASLIGFLDAADDTGSTAYTADNQAEALYENTFTWPDTNEFPDNTSADHANGISLQDHRDKYTLRGTGFVPVGIQIQYLENDPHKPQITITLQGRDVARIAAVTPTMPSEVALTPDGAVTLDVTLNGNAHTGVCFKTLNLNITLPTALRHCIGDLKAVRPVRTGKLAWNLDFNEDEHDDDTLSADHDATWQDHDAVVVATVTHYGLQVRGSTDALKEMLKLELRSLRPTGQITPTAAGTLDKPFQYVGQYDSANSRAGLAIVTRSRLYLAS